MLRLRQTAGGLNKISAIGSLWVPQNHVSTPQGLPNIGRENEQHYSFRSTNGPRRTYELALFSSGLSATAFRNDASGEIVISYKGTDFIPDNLFQTISDLLADLTLGTGLAAPSLGALKSNKPLQGPGARIIGTPKFIRGISPC